MARLRQLIGVVALFLAVSAPAARASVADYVGKPVASVRLVIEGRDVADASLLQVVETHVGRPLSMADVRESITHLFSLGRFEDVRADATLAGAGVALRYELTPIHPVAKIQFAGNLHAPGVDEGRLRRAVVDRYGVAPPLGHASEVARLVAEHLQYGGYLHPRVTPRSEIEHAPERATLVLVIDPGARTAIGTIAVAGRPVASRAELLAQLRIASGAPYEREALAERIDRYIEQRRKAGYYEAKLVPTVSLADGDRVANLTLTVTPGPHMRVVFAGDSLPSDQREELVPVEREGSADEDLLEDSSNRIEEFLRAQGYRDASAPHARNPSNDELLITFTVKRGRQYRVDRVEVSGNASVSLLELVPALRLREGQPFSDAKLDADVVAIESAYRRSGFAGVKAQGSIELRPTSAGAGEAAVLVRIAIAEGARTVVGSITIAGNQSIDEAALREVIRLQPGQPYFDAQLAADRDAIQLQYANRGYQNATVDARPNFSTDATRADPVLTVQEGPRILVDHVLIVGNVRTSTKTIERALQLKTGDPLSLAAVNESQRRLAALSLFRRTRITELRHGDQTKRDLLVTVEEAPATTLGYGGGGEVRLRVVRREQDGGVAAQRLEFAPRASFQIGRRNLFGKNRSVNLFTSVSLHPNDSPFFADNAAASADGGYGFTEYRVLGTFREPRAFDTASDVTLTGVLEQQIRSGFNFSRRSAGAQAARHLTREVTVTGHYQIQRTRLFDVSVSPSDLPLIDRTFSKSRLSSFSSSVVRDTRDDAVDPSGGQYWSAYGQLAGRAIGSEIGFGKSFFTAQLFRQLPRTNRIVFAADARLGLAKGFQREVESTDADGNPTVETVANLPEPDRFFAGGDTTVRGFALDTLGTPETLKNGFPVGGNGLVILNAELRVPVGWGVGVVGFFDTGNVFEKASDLDLGELRSAIGFGVRYKSPVGPIRIDLGFKLHRAEIAAGVREGLTALHISFGQAF